MLLEIAQNYNDNFNNFLPFPSAEDRVAWNSLDEEWKNNTLLLGQKYIGYLYSYLSPTDFMDFLRTGNRVMFEDKYFSKRLVLNALVLAECVEYQGRFLDDIINGIFSICEESAWQLPAHNTYIRDTPQFLLPDATTPVLDLFACETGAILGTVYYLLKHELDSISPFITKRIRHELQNRIILPYLEQHFWWMGNGQEPMNNWTIWCTQNVLLSVFLTDTDEIQKKEVFLKACKSADFFLKEYGEDGCCDEGAQYYRHAGLCLYQVIEICNSITNNNFLSLYQNTKIKNIAAYIFNVHISNEYYVNFADCSPIAGCAGTREFLFAKRTCNKAMMHFAAKDFVLNQQENLLLSSEHNLFYRLQNAFLYKEICEYAKDFCKNPINDPPDMYYPSVGLFLARDSHMFLAIKAGDNNDSHNHNDTGSFIVYKNGQPMLIDIGVESYTKKTFSPKRYEIWTMQSAYHNLPTVNGIMQKDGENYQAKNVHYQFENSFCEMEMDIADCYPSEANLLFYKRHAVFQKEQEIMIQDSFAFHGENDFKKNTSSVQLSFITYEKPILMSSRGNACFAIGKLGTLTIENGTHIKTEAIPITDPRLSATWKHEIYRIFVSANKNDVKMFIS